jgi:hypothetical protein
VIVDHPELLTEGARVKVVLEAPETVLTKTWTAAMTEMGVRGQPISVAELRR